MAAEQIKKIAQNKKAYHDYFILETYEAGIELFGTEVKSIREGRINLKDSWCSIDGGEIMTQTHPTYRSEYAFGYPVDSSIFIVDTQLAAEYDGGVYYPLGNWGYYWGSLHPDSGLSKAIRKLNGLNYPYRVDDAADPTNIHWDRKTSGGRP